MNVKTNKSLTYPFDQKDINRNRKKIRSALLHNESLKKIRIAILGGSTTHEIKSCLELFLLNTGFEPFFYESEYAKYMEEVLLDDERLIAFEPEIVIIHTTHFNLVNQPKLFASPNEVEVLIEKELNTYRRIWSKLTLQFNCTVIQNNFDCPQLRKLGNLDSTELFGTVNFINRLNQAFAEESRNNRKLVINDIHYLSSKIGLEKWFNIDYWHNFKMAVSHEGSIHLGHNLSSIINSIQGKSKKCLILDLDNTLWGGEIAEVGKEGIVLGHETPLGEAFISFQKYCLLLKERGILLAICSKNDESVALDGFSHPDMILKLEDISSFKANYDPKSINIKKIATALNIGLDSIVFIDDNPFERSLVAEQFPMVAVPDIGENASRFINYIENEGYFEAVFLTPDDVKRTEFYKNNSERDSYVNEFKNYKEYLKHLDMEVEIGSFQPIYFDRITQLTNKTNQFNLTTKRYSFSQIETISTDRNHINIYGRLKDKFGDNGIVSVISGEMKGASLHINLWLMSCRVLKRDLELAMFNALINKAKAKGIEEIIGYYEKTPKNSMVAKHYANMGFDLTSIDDHQNKSTWKFSIPNQKTNTELFFKIIYV